MKKGILLLIGMMTLATASAKNIEASTNKIGVNYRYNDAVTFVERGIQFHVFLNGNFDFNTHSRNNRYYDYNGIRINQGVRIERNYRGQVRRVGNVFINYDHRGNVKRIGNIYIRYRHGQLRRVGNLRISYDRWGYPIFRGNVKSRRYYNDYYDRGNECNFEIDVNFDIFDYDDVYFYRNDFRNNYRKYREDDNFYYYRAQPNAKIGKRNKLLKRRKPAKNSRNRFRIHEEKKVEDNFTRPEQRGKSRRSRR